MLQFAFDGNTSMAYFCHCFSEQLRHATVGFIYTLAEGILISVRSLQRSEGDVSDPIKYIYS